VSRSSSPHDAVGEHVLDRTEVQLAFAGAVLGNIAEPQLVWFVGGEVAFDEIVVHWWPDLAVRAPFTFHGHARRVIQTAQLAKDSMSVYHGELTGTVDLGSLIAFGRLDAPKVLGEFHRIYPFVRIELRQS
jgi:hypothetical protein